MNGAQVRRVSASSLHAPRRVYARGGDIPSMPAPRQQAAAGPLPLAEVLPKAGLVVSEKGGLSEVLCKPKILPIKSLTLQKLEEMEVGSLASCSGSTRTGAVSGRQSLRAV
jgi:hypothetical protein